MKSAATNKQAKILAMPDVQTKTDIENQIYRIYELQAELKRGKENYEKMLLQYQAVIDALTESGKKDQFPEGTIEQFTKDKADIQKGLENIGYRLKMIDMLLNYGKSSNESKAIVEYFVSLVFQILGLGLPGAEESDEQKE